MATRSSVATDNFDRASLGSNWTQLNSGWGSMAIASNQLKGGTGLRTIAEGSAAVWAGAGTFSNDQYAKIEITNLPWQNTSHNLGVIVRASTDTGAGRDFYYALVCADASGPNYTVSFGKCVNGTVTKFNETTTTFAVNDTIEIEAEGTTLRLMRNGTALGGSWTTTDSDLTTGTPGAIGDGDGTILGDNWESGDLVADSSVAPLAGRHLQNLMGQ